MANFGDNSPTIENNEAAFIDLHFNRQETWEALEQAGLTIDDVLREAISQESERTKLGDYQIYSKHSEKEHIVALLNPRGLHVGDHKYIFAHNPETGEEYIIAAPVESYKYHKDILKVASEATGKRLHCSGGGHITLDLQWKLETCGFSMDFGEGDHERALRAFTDAIIDTIQREE